MSLDKFDDPLDLLGNKWPRRFYALIVVTLLVATFALAAYAEKILWIAAPAFLIGIFFGFFTIRIQTGKWH